MIALALDGIAASRMLPGAEGEEPHVDYPCRQVHVPEAHPIGLDAGFAMAAPVSVILDPFVESSGAADNSPCSQRALRAPAGADDVHGRAERVAGKPRDAAPIRGATWHCAAPSLSDHDRSALPIQSPPKRLTPGGNMPATPSSAIVDGASAGRRDIPGPGCPCFGVPDRAAGGDVEGRA